MKWYKHLFIYLGCIAFTELICASCFLLEQFNGHNIWYMFAWLQIGIPFITLVIPFLTVEALISADNEMLEKYKKENKDE